MHAKVALLDILTFHDAGVSQKMAAAVLVPPAQKTPQVATGCKIAKCSRSIIHCR